MRLKNALMQNGLPEDRIQVSKTCSVKAQDFANDGTSGVTTAVNKDATYFKRLYVKAIMIN